MEPDFFDLKTLREGVDIEFKTGEGRDGLGEIPKSLWETYSAMANTEGGFIFLGIKEKKKNDGFDYIGVKTPEKLLCDLWNGLNNPEKVSVNILKNQDVSLVKCDGVQIIRIKVPVANRKQKPVFIKGNPLNGTFRRNNEGDYRCSEEVVKQMLGDQANDTRDSLLLEGFSFEDLNLPTLQVFRQHFTNRKPNHPFNDYNDLEFLRNIGGWGVNRHTKHECPTLAGLLMFGKLRAILDAVPNYIVDYQELPRSSQENRWIDRITTDFTWSGNLYDFYRLVIGKLYEGLKVPFQLSGDERVEDTVVHEALREALVNTVVHADYSGNCSLFVVKRPDLFGFRNPGLFRVPIADALRGGVSDCRNRNLQKMFQLIGLGEQAGSGFPKIYKNWKAQHWKNPTLEERFDSNQTLLVLRMTSLLPEEVVSSLRQSLGKRFDSLDQLEHLAVVTAKAEGCVTHRRLTELSKEHPSELTQVLHGLVDKKIFRSEGGGKGTFYYLEGEHPISGDMVRGFESVARSSEHSDQSIEHLEKSSEHLLQDSEHYPRLQQIADVVRKSKKSEKKVVRQVIYELCSVAPLSMSELAFLLKRNEDSLRNHYINIMCEDGVLKRQFPNIIKHPKQRYIAAIVKSRS